VVWIGAAWVAGNLGVFGITFGIGHVVLGSPGFGTPMAVGGLIAIALTLRATARARSHLMSTGVETAAEGHS
jgi:hypothetical protein